MSKFYPRDYDDKELGALIDRYGDLNVDKFNIGPSYFTKAVLGLAELERRSSSKLGWWSFGISVLAMVLSGFAVWFTILAIRDDKIWQTQEIELLNQINQNMKSINIIRSNRE